MLTESFLVSTLNSEKPSNSATPGIHLYEFQPLPSLRSTFKKTSTNTNCLAVSASHVFAAQADKAVIHVYSRERNNQEAVVPFPEKICSIDLSGESDGAGSLVLGTESGRIILWEVRPYCWSNAVFLVILTASSSLQQADKFPHRNITFSQQHALLWIRLLILSFLPLQIQAFMSGLSQTCSRSQPHRPTGTDTMCRSPPFDHF